MNDQNNESNNNNENDNNNNNDDNKVQNTAKTMKIDHDNIINNNNEDDDGDDENEDDDDDDEEEEEGGEDDDDETESGDSSDDNGEDDTETENENNDDDENDKSMKDDDNDIQMPLSPNSTPTCYICLNIFEGQDIGSPDSCESIHYFCLECIEEWSKQINTCPVDRKSFSYISVRRTINGEIVMKVPILKKSVLEIVTVDNDDVTYCEICGRCDREDRLLLCDGCDFGYHCECLVPPLETIPVDEWFCPDCFERLFGDDLNDSNNNNQHRLIQQQRRVLARTGAFERVRNRIMARRSIRTPTTSSAASTNRRTPVRCKRKKRKRKTTTTKKRKTTSNKSKTKTKTTRRKKYRKRTKKSKLSMKRLPAADPRSRLASRLGLICKPKAPFGTLNTIKPLNLSNRSTSEQYRHFSGINNSLSMFGYGLEMNHLSSYGDDEEDDDSYNNIAVVDGSVGSVGLLTTTTNIRPRNIYVNNKNKTTFTNAEVASSLPSFNIDVLSEIMNSQKILHAPSSDLSIARDGRIYLNTETTANNNNNNSIRKCPNNQSTAASSSNIDMKIYNNNTSNNSSNRRASISVANSYSSSNSSSSSSPLDMSHDNNHTEDISFIKPSPIISLNNLSDKNNRNNNNDDDDDDDENDDKNIDVEMYSDIESIQDDTNINNNTKELDNSADNNKNNNNENQCEQPANAIKNESSNNLNDDSNTFDKTSLMDINAAAGSNNIDTIIANDNYNSINHHDNDVETEKTVKNVKRRPSINDLFGGDSDDSDDFDDNDNDAKQKEMNELTKLIQQPTGINAHFPIKMPLVLKTNLFNDKNNKSSKNGNDGDIKKWIPIYPETSKNDSNGGSKWKAIGVDIDKKDNIEMSKNNESESIKQSEPKRIEIKKVEKFEKGETSNNNVRDKREEISSKLKDSFKNVQIQNEDIFADIFDDLIPIKKPTVVSKLKDNESKPKPQSPLSPIQSTSSDNDKAKIRKCKHGRPLTHKNKDISSSSSSIASSSTNKRRLDDNEMIKSNNNHNNNQKRDPIIWDRFHDDNRKLSRNEHQRHHHNEDDIRLRKDDYEHSKSKHHKHHHHHHHHHHHRHHHHKHNQSTTHNQNTQRQQQQQQQQDKHDSVTKSYPKIDSKEIYEQGDKIIINVNFKKQEMNPENRDSSKESNNNEPKKMKESSSKPLNKSETIETISPERPSKISYDDSPLIFDSPLDFNIFDDDDNDDDDMKFRALLSKSHTKNNNKPLNSSDDQIKSSSTSTTGNNEYKFSPIRSNFETNDNDSNMIVKNDKITNFNDSFNSDKNDYNSFLPTPTQDESQTSQMLIMSSSSSSNFKNISSKNDPKLSSSRISTFNESDSLIKKDSNDFYDPELPLQSPDHSLLSSSSSSPIDQFKKVDTIFKKEVSFVETTSLKNTFLSKDSNKTATTIRKLESFTNFSQLLEHAQTLRDQQNQNKSKSMKMMTTTSTSNNNNSDQDIIEIVDMDVASPNSLSPQSINECSSSTANLTTANAANPSPLANVKEIWDQIIKTASSRLNESSSKHNNENTNNTINSKNNNNNNKKIRSNGDNKRAKQLKNDFLDDDEHPKSAVDMEIKEKYIKKLNRQERVIEEVKLSLKPYYQKKKINKDEYKNILRKAVPKICHSKSGEINPIKIKKLVEAYVKHFRHQRKS